MRDRESSPTLNRQPDTPSTLGARIDTPPASGPVLAPLGAARVDGGAAAPKAPSWRARGGVEKREGNRARAPLLVPVPAALARVGDVVAHHVERQTLEAVELLELGQDPKPVTQRGGGVGRRRQI